METARSGWLKAYYERLCEDARFDIGRKDTFTYWALTLFLAIFAVYAGLWFQQVPSLWRLSILYVAGALLTRFFVHSCLAYAGILRWRHLTKKIEQTCVMGSGNISQIYTDIKEYDHESKIPVKRRKLVVTQLKAGFGIIFGLVFILILYESLLLAPSQDALVFLLLTTAAVAYIVYEGAAFLAYGKMKTAKAVSSRQASDTSSTP